MLDKVLSVLNKIKKKIKAKIIVKNNNLSANLESHNPPQQTEKVYSLSPDYSLKQLEEIYNNVILKQSFYDSDYSQSWQATPYQAMAEIIISVLNPTSHVDIGCGTGLLVQAMRDKGVESYGVEYSESLVKQADLSIQQYVKNVSIETFITEYQSNSEQYMLISLTEVCEHLPISILENTFSFLYKNYKNYIFLTIPSYGIDGNFKYGIKVNPDTPSWLRDMKENIPFKNIVLEDGVPHHGHITLASYRWWTEFFLYHGWSRNRDLEVSCGCNFEQTLKTYNWNPYILNPIVEVDQINKSIKSGKSLGLGWYEYDNEIKGRWTDGFARIFFKANSFGSIVKLKCSSPTINIIQNWQIYITIDYLAKDSDYKFTWKPQAFSQALEITRESESEIEFLLSPLGISNTTINSASNCFRINILSPRFNPSDYDFNMDTRELGILVHSIDIVDGYS